MCCAWSFLKPFLVSFLFWPFFFFRYLRLASTKPARTAAAGNGVGGMMMLSTPVGTMGAVQAPREVANGRLVCKCLRGKNACETKRGSERDAPVL